MKFTQDNGADGTCLQGYIDTTYATLVKTFGEPHNDGDGYKVDAEWCLKFEDGTVATIYNYKDGKNYNGKAGKATKNITEWHIGGHSKKAVECVTETVHSHSQLKANNY